MSTDVVNDDEMEDGTTPSDFFDHEPSKQEKIEVSLKFLMLTELVNTTFHVLHQQRTVSRFQLPRILRSFLVENRTVEILAHNLDRISGSDEVRDSGFLFMS